jgi:hypothetical protein
LALLLPPLSIGTESVAAHGLVLVKLESAAGCEKRFVTDVNVAVNVVVVRIIIIVVHELIMDVNIVNSNINAPVVKLVELELGFLILWLLCGHGLCKTVTLLVDFLAIR